MTEPFHKVEIGGCTLYRGDCRAILPLLPRADAVVTDPPYGIGYSTRLPGAKQFAKIIGDDTSPELTAIFRLECEKIIFGANNFPSALPHRGRWICWDKRGGMAAADRMLGSPFELAWEDKDHGFDGMIRLLHGGVVNHDGFGISREHPTQKPIELMKGSRINAGFFRRLIHHFISSMGFCEGCSRLIPNPS